MKIIKKTKNLKRASMKIIIKNEEVLCPHCKKYLFEEEFLWDFKYKFCPYCGKEITTDTKEQENEKNS